jgi:hypothetical protein
VIGGSDVATVVELVGGIDVVMTVELVGGTRVASVDVVALPPQATNATVQSAPRIHDTS